MKLNKYVNLDNPTQHKIVIYLHKAIRLISNNLADKFESMFRPDFVNSRKDGVLMFKWLKHDLNGPYRKYPYKVPTLANKFEITTHSEEIAQICNKGFHCTDLSGISRWESYSSDLYLVEVFGDFDAGFDVDKITFTNIRILEKVRGDASEYPAESIENYCKNNLPLIRKLSSGLSSLITDEEKKLITVDFIVDEISKLITNNQVYLINTYIIMKTLRKHYLGVNDILAIGDMLLNRGVLENHSYSSIFVEYINLVNAMTLAREKAEKKANKVPKKNSPRIDKYTGKPKVKRKPKK